MVKPEQYGVVGFKSIWWGDDVFSSILDEKGPYKSEGRMVKKYFVIVTETLARSYPWLMEEGKTSSTKYGPAIWVEYPCSLVNDKNTSRANGIERIYCAFDGSETPETERVKDYTRQIEELETECNHLKESNVYIMDMYGQALKNVKQLAKDLAEINEIMQKGGGKVESEEEPEGRGYT